MHSSGPPARTLTSLTQSALWLIAAKMAVVALGLAVPLLLVRQLTVWEFGVYKQLFLLVDTAVVILPLGSALSAFYFFPRQPERKAQVVRNIMLVHALMGGAGAVLVAAYPSLPAGLLNSHDLAAYAPAIGLIMFFLVASAFFEFVAIANGEARLAALVLALSQLLRSALFVIVGWGFGTLRALTYAAVVHGLLQSVMVAWYVRSRFPAFRWTVDWQLARAQFAYALPLAYAGVIWWMQGWVHHYFVSHRVDAAVYAVYAVGCFQLPVLGVLLESVGYVAIRRVSELRSRNATREIVDLAARAVRALAAVILPLYAFLLVTGPQVITVLFTDQYRDSWPILAVNLTLLPLSITFPVCDAVFRACPEHLPFLVKVRTALLLPLLGGLWIATGSGGLVAAIAVVVGVTLLERVALALKAARILRMSWSDRGLFRDVVKVGVAAGAAGIVTHATIEVMIGHGFGDAPLAVLALSTGVFAPVFLAAVLLFRGLTLDERSAIRHWFGRVFQAMPRRHATEIPNMGRHL